MNAANTMKADLLSPDRNVRARAVKRIATQVTAETRDAMLLALNDTKSRVREVAVKYCAPFLKEKMRQWTVADNLSGMTQKSFADLS